MSNQPPSVRIRALQNSVEISLKAWSDSDSLISSNLHYINEVLNRPDLPEEARIHLQRLQDLARNLKNNQLAEIEQVVRDCELHVFPLCPWLHDTSMHNIIGRLRLIISVRQTIINCISELLGSSEIPQPIQQKLSAIQRTAERANISIRTLQSIVNEISRIQKEIREYLEEPEPKGTCSDEITLKVIILEDDSIWQQAIASIVQEQLGVKPYKARSQKEFMDLLCKIRKSRHRSSTHIVVILDLGLPEDVGRDASLEVGREILEALRDFKINADVIILTSYTRFYDVQRLAAQLGVNPHDYILKGSNWVHDLNKSLETLDYRFTLRRLRPYRVELAGKDINTDHYLVRIDTVTIPLPLWLYQVFAILCRYGRGGRCLTSDRIIKLVEYEYERTLEKENIFDAVYRLRKAIWEAFNNAEQYFDSQSFIIEEKRGEEVTYRIPNNVTVIDRELGEGIWDVEVDLHNRKVRVNGREVILEELEFEIFSVLARSRRALSEAKIASLVNCPQDLIYKQVSNIRDKIGRSLDVGPKKIEELIGIVTLPHWKRGFKLCATVTWHGSEFTNASQEFSILLVEDDPIWRDAIRKVIEEYGCDVLEADSVESAIQVAKEKRPPVLCLDLELPEKSGGERKSLDGGLKVLKTVSKFIPDVRVVVITAYAEYGELRSAVLKAEVRSPDFLQKGEPGWESKLICSIHRIKREIETASLLPVNIEAVPSFQGVIRLNRNQPRQMVICAGTEEVVVRFSKNRAHLIWTLAEAQGGTVLKDELIKAIYGSKKPKDPVGALKSLINDTRKDIEEALQRHGKRLKAESILVTTAEGYRLAGVVKIEG